MERRSRRGGRVGGHFAANLRAARARRRISQRQLAALLAEYGHPLAATAIAKIELETRTADVDDLVVIARVLGVRVDWMLNDNAL